MVLQAEPSIIANQVPCVGITSNEEARVVRKHGYTGKIMRVRAASKNEIEGGLEYQMEELIGTKHRPIKSSTSPKHTVQPFLFTSH